MNKNLLLAITSFVIFSLFLVGINQYQKSKYTFFTKKYLEAADLGGQWFVNNQNEEFLEYMYFPNTDKYSVEGHPLREIASMWALTQLAKEFKKEEYNQLAHKGWLHWQTLLEYDQEGDYIYLNYDPKQIKLGYSAFLVLALIDLKVEDKDYYLEKLANGILAMQKEDGSFRTFFKSKRTSGQDFYPGEALLALMTLYEHTGDARYLNAVEKAWPYYKKYWYNHKNTAFIPWQTQAYVKLYKARPHKALADFIFTMNDYIVDQYYHNKKQQFIFDKGIVTAAHLEGTIRAYDLARELGDEEHLLKYGDFILNGLGYIMSLQETADTKHKTAAIGGFWGKNFETMQVDRNQHAVMALMAGHDVFNR